MTTKPKKKLVKKSVKSKINSRRSNPEKIDDILSLENKFVKIQFTHTSSFQFSFYGKLKFHYGNSGLVLYYYSNIKNGEHDNHVSFRNENIEFIHKSNHISTIVIKG